MQMGRTPRHIRNMIKKHGYLTPEEFSSLEHCEGITMEDAEKIGRIEDSVAPAHRHKQAHHEHSRRPGD